MDSKLRNIFWISRFGENLLETMISRRPKVQNLEAFLVYNALRLLRMFYVEMCFDFMKFPTFIFDLSY